MCVDPHYYFFYMQAITNCLPLRFIVEITWYFYTCFSLDWRMQCVRFRVAALQMEHRAAFTSGILPKKRFVDVTV